MRLLGTPDSDVRARRMPVRASTSWRARFRVVAGSCLCIVACSAGPTGPGEPGLSLSAGGATSVRLRDTYQVPKSYLEFTVPLVLDLRVGDTVDAAVCNGEWALGLEARAGDGPWEFLDARGCQQLFAEERTLVGPFRQEWVETWRVILGRPQGPALDDFRRELRMTLLQDWKSVDAQLRTRGFHLELPD